MRRMSLPLRSPIAFALLGALGCGGAADGTGPTAEPPVPPNLEAFDERVVERVENELLALRGDLADPEGWKRLGLVYEAERLSSLAEGRARREGSSADQVRTQWLSQVPEGRLGRPEETAAAVAFLCSPAAAYIRGVSLPVDGGRLRGI